MKTPKRVLRENIPKIINKCSLAMEEFIYGEGYQQIISYNLNGGRQSKENKTKQDKQNKSPCSPFNAKYTTK